MLDCLFNPPRFIARLLLAITFVAAFAGLALLATPGDQQVPTSRCVPTTFQVPAQWGGGLAEGCSQP
jgi:hypothetical protein